MTPLETLARTVAARDPETLIGPLMYLFTRRVANDGARVADAMLADHLAALAAHPRVDPLLRLAAGALAIEHRAHAHGRHHLVRADS